MIKPVIQKAQVNDPAIMAAPDNEQGYVRFAHLNYLAREIAKQISATKHYEVEVTSSNIYVELTTERGILDFEFQEGFDGDVDLFDLHLSTYQLTGDYNPVPDNYYVQLTVYSNGTAIPVTWVSGYNETANVKIKNLNAGENDWGTRFYLYYEIVKIS